MKRNGATSALGTASQTLAGRVETIGRVKPGLHRPIRRQLPEGSVSLVVPSGGGVLLADAPVRA